MSKFYISPEVLKLKELVLSDYVLTGDRMVKGCSKGERD